MEGPQKKLRKKSPMTMVTTLMRSVWLLLAVWTAAADARLRGSMLELCEEFLGVSDFVVAQCTADTTDANCLQSFQLFYESPALLIACEKHAETRNAKVKMTKFMEIYSQWQQRHTCELFHAKEAQAAQQCGGAAVQKPWHEEVYPLYCEEIFNLYNSNRKDLDAMCGRTRFSDAFWEAYADFVATPLCKTYYSHVRGATSHGCAGTTASDADKCEAMFQWYTQQRTQVEKECLEVQGAKKFYKGFYAWKRHQK